jgi:hypothetical protein
LARNGISVGSSRCPTSCLYKRQQPSDSKRSLSARSVKTGPAPSQEGNRLLAEHANNDRARRPSERRVHDELHTKPTKHAVDRSAQPHMRTILTEKSPYIYKKMVRNFLRFASCCLPCCDAFSSFLLLLAAWSSLPAVATRCNAGFQADHTLRTSVNPSTPYTPVPPMTPMSHRGSTSAALPPLAIPCPMRESCRKEKSDSTPLQDVLCEFLRRCCCGRWR